MVKTTALLLALATLLSCNSSTAKTEEKPDYQSKIAHYDTLHNLSVQLFNLSSEAFDSCAALGDKVTAMKYHEKAVLANEDARRYNDSVLHYMELQAAQPK